MSDKLCVFELHEERLVSGELNKGEQVAWGHAQGGRVDHRVEVDYLLLVVGDRLVQHESDDVAHVVDERVGRDVAGLHTQHRVQHVTVREAQLSAAHLLTDLIELHLEEGRSASVEVRRPCAAALQSWMLDAR